MRIILKKQVALLVLIGISATIIFIKNYGEEKRLSVASSSFTELYDDRLLAEHLIYRMTDLVHKKWSLQRTAVPGLQESRELSKELAVLLGKFGATKLAPGERAVFFRLENRIKMLMHNAALPEPEMSATYTEALSLLSALSEIQITEGTRLKQEGQVVLASSMLGIKFQSALFIVLLLSLLALLKNLWVTSPVQQRHELN